MKESKYIVLGYVNVPHILYPYVDTIKDINEDYLESQERLMLKVSKEHGNGYIFKYLLFNLSKEEDINKLLLKLLEDLEHNSKIEMKDKYLKDFEVGAGKKIFKALKNYIEIPKKLFDIKSSKIEGTLEEYVTEVRHVLNRATSKYI